MKKMMILSALAAVMLSPVAVASEPGQQLRIGLDDIDLTTSRGMDAAQRRIDRAVKDFCRNNVEHLSLKGRRGASECRDELRGDALAKLNDRRVQQWAAR